MVRHGEVGVKVFALILEVDHRGERMALLAGAARSVRPINHVVLVEPHSLVGPLATWVTSRTTIAARCAIILKLKVCLRVWAGPRPLHRRHRAVYIRFVIPQSEMTDVLAANLLRHLFGGHKVLEAPLRPVLALRTSSVGQLRSRCFLKLAKIKMMEFFGVRLDRLHGRVVGCAESPCSTAFVLEQPRWLKILPSPSLGRNGAAAWSGYVLFLR